ncbi:hypothetical protein L6452_40630 [Arctium lappa]|uniref:Uncharacterized protein n=1 Tax=Arctium lappa TaxID=4217 RepID=A0ACB8XNK8_ARCLA|nr:hypothetical protein L6452_40630 [Arctium lappa]
MAITPPPPRRLLLLRTLLLPHPAAATLTVLLHRLLHKPFDLYYLDLSPLTVSAQSPIPEKQFPEHKLSSTPLLMNGVKGRSTMPISSHMGIKVGKLEFIQKKIMIQKEEGFWILEVKLS